MKFAPLIGACTVWAVSAAHATDMGCSALTTWLASQASISNVVGGFKPGRCEITFTYASRGDTVDGYAAGQRQAIQIRVGLPLSSVDGGTGGVVGAWNGKVQNLGGGGLVGELKDVGSTTALGYVGSSTDGGHAKADNPNFAVIQETHSLNLGRLDDFMIESVRQQYQWALRLAATYYGQAASRNYWNGCSTGGRQGLSLALAHAEDFDGFLIAAPAVHHSRLQMSTLWPWWVNKDLAADSVTVAKMKKVDQAAIQACDPLDGLTDGLVSRPSACTYDAALSVCGKPGVSNVDCLSPLEAQVINRMWGGPVDDNGQSLWVPFERGANQGVKSNDACGSLGLQCWSHLDTTFNWRTLPLAQFDDEAQLALDVVGPYADVTSTALEAVRARGAKIIMWHGTLDSAIPPQQSVRYYEDAIQRFGGIEQLMPWFRLFLLPGVGHCGGGKGPQPDDLLGALERWVENGVAPDRLVALNKVDTRVTRSRPMCAWPKVAIYKGSGSASQASSFSCVN